MASKVNAKNGHTSITKRTSQGGNKPKTSSMNKTKKTSFKVYRGQGR